MKTIAGRLQKAGAPVQLILMCGRNERLAGELHSLRGPVPMLVQPFTRDVARYMRLADFFIGKPGPGSISEALAMGLPVIVERSARTMVQERYNVDWILERGVGLAVTSFSRIDRAVADLLAPARLATLHANIAAVENRAVFEIVGILGEIFEPGRSPAAPPVPATGPGC
jgi:1,2-diacylglycerol 3-beta-galactosyltransferase